MLYVHYTSGFEADTLCFEEVCQDDPSILGPEYVDLPEDQFPELRDDLWWKMPPSSGEFYSGNHLYCRIITLNHIVSLNQPTPQAAPLGVVIPESSSQRVPATNLPSVKLKLKPPVQRDTTGEYFLLRELLYTYLCAGLQ